MASGTITGSTGNQYIDAKIEWSSTTNTTANTSTVTAKLYYKRNNSEFATSGTGTFSITINGVKTTRSKYLNITASAWVFAITAYATVSHNDDGTKGILISSSGSIPSTTLTSTSCSGYVTLDTIPRASTITSATDTVLGTPCAVKWTPHSKTFSYRLTFTLKEWNHRTDVIHPNTTSAYTYTDYTLPLEAARQIPNSATGDMQVTIDTYSNSNGTGYLGSSKAVTLKVTVPYNDDTKPNVDMSLAPKDSPFAGVYIQGRSKVSANIRGTFKLGTSISSYIYTVDGKGYTVGASAVSEVLSRSGEITVVGGLKDTRGHSTTVEQKINVIPYSKPKLLPTGGEKSIICARCDASGNLSESGTYLKIAVKREYSKVMSGDTQLNKCTLYYSYKRSNDPSFGNYNTLLAGDAEADYTTLITKQEIFEIDMSYLVQIRAEDTVGEITTITFAIPTAFAAFHLKEGGKGAAFGKYATTDNLLECAWDARFNGKLFLHDNEMDVVIESGKSGLWNYRLWQSGNAELWGVITLSTFGDARHIYLNAGLPFPFLEYPTVCMTLSQAVAYEYTQGAIVLSEVYTEGASTIKLMMIRDEGGLASGNTAKVSVFINGKWK